MFRTFFISLLTQQIELPNKFVSKASQGKNSLFACPLAMRARRDEGLRSPDFDISTDLGGNREERILFSKQRVETPLG